MLDLNPATIIARAVVLLVAFTFHELSHAVTADYLGDPTARRLGRITLNPLAHLDPIGTLLLLVAGFGWAKPVPVNPYNLRGNPRTSMALVAAAGPISNLIMATVFALPFRLNLVNFAPGSSGILPSPDHLMSEFITINLLLAFFNLIPIPPLDGYKILYGLLPPQMAFKLEPLEQYGFLILLILVMLGQGVLGLLIGTPVLLTRYILIGA
ncbi:MAG: site-2 protease family protein [Chloroflexi bacterium]|nr:site-2 protease family protein [Chloroflexota bacterium]MCI0578631.1 site-2 protease family protein [Chloroflexota bacterium]MCI0647204.1 site-2 protease family protein [Chloroflexota bacterium]MCI0728930.1 site-2 protease family protein [Chloroflexota bacterium]